MISAESLFAKYLEDHNLSYGRDFLVIPGNVDFRIFFQQGAVLADTKEVRDSPREANGKITAEIQIRDDIKKLRKKFGNGQVEPVLLVTVNASSSFFTGLTVARALFGEIGTSGQALTEAHHLERGNAAFNSTNNTIVSGLLLLTDSPNAPVGFLFKNPWAIVEISSKIFPDVIEVDHNRGVQGLNLIDLSKIMIWPIGGGTI